MNEVFPEAKPKRRERESQQGRGSLPQEDKPVSVWRVCSSQPYRPDGLVPASNTQQATRSITHHLRLRLLLLLRSFSLPDKMPVQSTLSSKAQDTQSDGKSFEQLRQECLQKGVLFEDPDFPATDSSLFFSESVPVQIQWKRPKVCRQF